jgi:hypothetical protein
VAPVKYELGFHSPEDGILHTSELLANVRTICYTPNTIVWLLNATLIRPHHTVRSVDRCSLLLVRQNEILLIILH